MVTILDMLIVTKEWVVWVVDATFSQWQWSP